MKKVVLEPIVLERLGSCPDEAELCNPSGQTVGFFVPPWLHRKLWYAWAHQMMGDTTPEELESLRKEPEGASTAEVIEFIHRLAGNPTPSAP